MLKSPIYLALLSLVVSLGSLPALAQSPSPASEASVAPESSPSPADPTETSPQPAPPPPPRRTPPSAASTLTPEQVSDQQIEQLVSALLELDPLIRQASTDLKAAETAKDDAKYQQIFQETEVKATQIVQKTGLTVEQYRQIMTLANENPTLKQRVQQHLDKVKPAAATNPADSPAVTSPTPPTSNLPSPAATTSP
ncbi:MAG: DUF4168 domain-containing protein [Cyanobacteriota bacterium]|nr:DUF4168 domain-containing protein [Cyanobacteriota bacterium]